MIPLIANNTIFFPIFRSLHFSFNNTNNMEDDHLGSIFNYEEEAEAICLEKAITWNTKRGLSRATFESDCVQVVNDVFHFKICEQLRQKLSDTTHELETMKNIETELLKLLKKANRERNKAKEQLQCLMKKLVTSHNSNMFLELQHNNINNLVPVQTKAISSITESNSSSHLSFPADSFFETTVSSSPSGDVFVDAATAAIDRIANGKFLPQNGKFLEAVLNSGPLLQNIILADSVPTWKNPPPMGAGAIKVPPLSVEDFNNFAGACSSSSSSNNMRQFTTTTTGSRDSLKKQRLQYFL